MTSGVRVVTMQAWRQPVRRRIVRDPEIMGGEPVLEGTRVPVSAIVLTYRLEPSFERLGEAYPMLDRAALVDALAFYRAKTPEIDRYIAEYEVDGG